MSIGFSSPPHASFADELLSQLHVFFVFIFGDQTDDGEGVVYNDIRLTHTSEEGTFAHRFAIATPIDPENPRAELQQFALQHLETVLAGICKHAKIAIADDLKPANFDQLVIEEIIPDYFERFINLITRHKISPEMARSIAQTLHDIPETVDYHQSIQSVRDHLIDPLTELSLLCNYDWKFSADEIKAIVGSLIGAEFDFTVPRIKHSADLLPAIQTALKKLKMQLISFENVGDDYYSFLLVNESDIYEIVQLAQILT
jgi:hypothetical protein